MRSIFQYIKFAQVIEMVASHKIGRLDKIGGPNWFFPKAQMRSRQGTCFFGIVHKITLNIEIRFITNDLDGVFVSAHCSIGTQAKEQSTEFVLFIEVKAFVIGQTQMGNIIVDAP